MVGVRDLPQHVLELIILRFGGGWAFNSSKDLLALRLVSKAWRSAVQEYRGFVNIDIESSTDLFGVCKFLPAMSSSVVNCTGLQFTSTLSQPCLD